ncbi:MAG: hypothetical protein IKR21_05265 [Oscillospiraceae bacterium]|nr:hypothetical protein [Oscillospiraceae bacterium]
MRSDYIVVSSDGSNMDKVMQETEKVAVYKELSKNGALHLRLLTEEMLGMMRSIAGKTDACFWIEDEDGVFQLHLQADTYIDLEQRKKLISTS